MPTRDERGSPTGRDVHRSLARLRVSRWPEVAWAVFAVGNLGWMVLVPSWGLLPFHLTWTSLLLLYGLGYRTCTRALTWWLLAPVMVGAALLLIDPRIRALHPYDALIELPMMPLMLFAITRHTSSRMAAMTALGAVSRRNAELLERQHAFVQNASHELRTPITVALAHAELHALNADCAEDTAVVVDELVRLHGLVERLLLLATAEQPGLLRPVPVRLVPLLADTARRWEPVPRTWQTDRVEDVVVLADPERLTVALDAVLENAIRFTGDGDRIELGLSRHNGAAAITIADNGPGIPDGQLDRVFDRFTRSGENRDPSGGFGLGLPIVRAIAEAHGGSVKAGRNPAGGTTVTLSLPLAAGCPGNSGLGNGARATAWATACRRCRASLCSRPARDWRR